MNCPLLSDMQRKKVHPIKFELRRYRIRIWQAAMYCNMSECNMSRLLNKKFPMPKEVEDMLLKLLKDGVPKEYRLPKSKYYARLEEETINRKLEEEQERNDEVIL
jgi:hypothetical protein